MRFLAVFVFIFFLSLTGPAKASQWEIVPGATVAGLLQQTQGRVVDASTSRLDPGLMVVVTYIQSGIDVYRCIEYVTEFQFEVTRSACFQAVELSNEE